MARGRREERTEHWVLGVDESGRLDEGRGLVAGVLLQIEDTAANAALLRAELLSRLPGLPWPLHATDLRRPITHAVGWLAPRRGPRSAFAFDEERCAASVAAVRASDHPAIIAVRESALRGKTAGWSSGLRAADEVFASSHPELWSDLTDLATDRRARLARLVGDLASHYGAERCFGVLAAGPDDAAAGVPVPGGVGHDRYLSLLEILFERLLQVRSQDEVSRVVHARIATRDIEQKLGGVRRGFPLRSHDWLQLLGRAMETVKAQGVVAASLPRFVAPEIVTRYDDHVHPIVVLADLLANSALGVCNDGTKLSTVSDHILSVTGLGLAARAGSLKGLPTLPTLAAGGPFRVEVEEALAGREGEGTPPRPRWAAEQSRAWVDAAGGRHEQG